MAARHCGAPRLFRRQWTHGHGFCGEAVVQMFALQHGTWRSLRNIRRAGGAELLLHRPDEGRAQWQRSTFPKALDALRVPWGVCTSTTTADFLDWLCESLRLGRLVVLGVQTPGGRNRDYDHILAVVDYDARTSTFVVLDPLLPSPGRVHVPRAALVQDRRSDRRFVVGSGHFYALALHHPAPPCTPSVGVTEILRRDGGGGGAWVPSDLEPHPSVRGAQLGARLVARNLKRGSRYTVWQATQTPDGAAVSTEALRSFVADGVAQKLPDVAPFEYKDDVQWFVTPMTPPGARKRPRS